MRQGRGDPPAVEQLERPRQAVAAAAHGGHLETEIGAQVADVLPDGRPGHAEVGSEGLAGVEPAVGQAANERETPCGARPAD